jgi:RNA polymerase-associated protein LEO1
MEDRVRLPDQDCVALPYPLPPENSTMNGTTLPASLLLQPLAFDPDLYLVDTKPVITRNEAGKPVVTKTIHNVVRWRNNIDEFGDLVRESNARIITWSDGSMSLMVGNESYEVLSSAYPDFRDIYVRQRPDANTESFLQCHGALHKKLTFNPTNIDKWRNDSMNFRKAVQRGVKQGSKLVANTQGFADPEEEKRVKEKLEERRASLSLEFSSKRGRTEQRQTTLTEDFLEQSDEEKETGSQTRRADNREKEKEKRALAAKKKRVRDRERYSEDEEEIDLFSDDSDMDY